MSDSIGVSDYFGGVRLCVSVCVALPEKSADAAPVTEPLACSSHTGRHRWARREIEQDCCKKHSDGSQLCQSTATQRHTCYFTDKTVRLIAFFKKVTGTSSSPLKSCLDLFFIDATVVTLQIQYDRSAGDTQG